MNCISLLLCIACLVLELVRKRKYYLISAFSTFWIIMLVLDAIHPFEVYSIDNPMTYTIILVGLICIYIGYYAPIILFRVTNNRKRNYKINSAAVDVLMIISILVLIPYFIFGIRSIISGNFSEVKLAFYTGTGADIPWFISFLYVYIANPMIVCGGMFFAESLLNNWYSRIKILYPIALIMNYIATARRFNILLGLVAIVSCFFINKDQLATRWDFSRISKRVKKILILFSVALLYLMISHGGEILEVFYHYTGLSITGLNIKLNDFELTKTQTLGLTSFYGFVNPFFEIISRLGFTIPQLMTLADKYISWQQYTIYVGSAIRYNAFYTLFYDMFLDGGILGVGIISFVLGRIWKIVQKNFEPDNIRSQIIYIYMITMVFTTMVRFPFASNTNALALIYIYLLTYENNILIKNKGMKL